MLSEISPSVSIAQKEQVRFLREKEVELKVVINEECYKRLEELKHLLSHKDPNLSYGKLLSLLSNEALKKHDPRQRNIGRKVSKNSTTQKISVKTQVSRKSETSPINFSAPKNHCVKNGSNTNLLKTEFSEDKPSIHKSLIYKNTPAPNKDKTNQIKPLQQHTRYIPKALRKQIWERDKGQCTFIHLKTGKQCGSKHLLQIDHIKPFSLGGRNEFKNLRLLCAGHNQFRNEKNER